MAFRSSITRRACRDRLQQVQRVVYSTVRTLESGGSPYYEAELEVKKSRFLGFARHASQWEDAKEFLEDIRSLHARKKPSHVCFGFQSMDTARSSDDGEPTGTAGVPILTAIQGMGLTNVICVVVRYYGGIPLGAGGLIRAYGSAARLVLKAAPVVETWPITRSLVLTLLTDSQPYLGAVYACFHKQQQQLVTVASEDYQADGSVQWTVICCCDMASLETFKASLRDATKGTIVFAEKNHGSAMPMENE
jgi:uncharacterized YigZ family protein